MTQFDLNGRRALVTGSSEGIGRAIALQLAAAGCDVVVHGLHSSSLGLAVVDEITATGGTARYIDADMADPSAVDLLLEQAGRIDILVSNVAVQIAQPYAQIGESELDWQFQINFKSALRLIQSVMPAMAVAGWGRIVTIGSVQEMRPHPDMLVYSSLKSAQAALVRSLAKQVAASGVTVNNVAPGVIVTRRNTDALSNAAYSAQVLDRIPAARFGNPKDVSGAVLLLCSDAGGYITGATIPVDGGMSL